MECPLAVRQSFDTSAAETYVLELAVPPRELLGSAALQVIAVAGSDNAVKIYSCDDLQTKAQLKNNTISPTNVVTGLQFAPDNPHIVYFSLLDGCIQCWDMRSSKPVQTYTDEGLHKYCSLGVNCTGKMIAAGTEATATDSFVIFWDTRKTEPITTFKDSHSDDITQSRFHPSDQQKLATGSTDGLVCIFNLSSMNEEDAIESVLNSESSVSKIGFFGSEWDFLFCLTHIESFQLWNVAEGELITTHANMRDKLKSHCKVTPDYLIDCLYCGNDWKDCSLCIAAGSGNGSVSLLSVENGDFRLTGRLVAGHLETVRCITAVPNSGLMATGGEDGFVCLWHLSSADGPSEKALPSDSLKVPSSLKAKRRREKPY